MNQTLAAPRVWTDGKRHLWWLGILPLEENFRAWMKEFAKTYPAPGRRKHEGKQFVWLDLYNNHINEIKLKAR